MMRSIGLIGTDDTLRLLLPHIDTWPAQGQHQRSLVALDCMVAVGTEMALVQLQRVAFKSRRHALQEAARTRIETLAAAWGLDREDLADRLVPRLDLDDASTGVLDFGPRTFTVGFDGQLRPFVRDASGKRLAELPKAGQKDDQEKAAAAHARWKALKKAARESASLQLSRLEDAMRLGRRWRADDFEQALLRHPLLTHLASALVWSAHDDDGRRVALFGVQEGMAIDVDERPFDLAGRTVGIPHPLSLTDAERGPRGEFVTDYQLVQPFPQLGREVFRMTDEERASGVSSRLKGRFGNSGRVLALEAKGWRRGMNGFYGGATFILMTKPLRTAPYQIFFTMEPGIDVGMTEYRGDEQTIENLVVLPIGQRPDDAVQGDGKTTFGDVPEDEFSEAVRDLTLIVYTESKDA